MGVHVRVRVARTARAEIGFIARAERNVGTRAKHAAAAAVVAVAAATTIARARERASRELTVLGGRGENACGSAVPATIRREEATIDADGWTRPERAHARACSDIRETSLADIENNRGGGGGGGYVLLAS